jgi:hypothetical protein
MDAPGAVKREWSTLEWVQRALRECPPPAPSQVYICSPAHHVLVNVMKAEHTSQRSRYEQLTDLLEVLGMDRELMEEHMDAPAVPQNLQVGGIFCFSTSRARSQSKRQGGDRGQGAKRRGGGPRLYRRVSMGRGRAKTGAARRRVCMCSRVS